MKKQNRILTYFRKVMKGDHRGFFLFVCAAIFICFCFICFLPGDNLFNWVRAKSDIRRQKKQIEYYNSQIEEIDREINTLTTNRDSLERFAREQFQYASPGDDVYIIGD